MSSSHALTILPAHRTLAVNSGTSLIEALVDHSIFLRSDCCGRGTCGKCLVQLIQSDGTKKETSACTQQIKSNLTIAVYLCHTDNKEVVSSVAVKNPQSIYGDDVVSRIGAIDMKRDSLDHLQKIVINAIEW